MSVVVLGSTFEDNNVTYDSTVSSSWIKLVQSKVRIRSGKTADDVSGFNNTITYQQPYPGIPPVGLFRPFFATNVVEWEKGETITITGGLIC